MVATATAPTPSEALVTYEVTEAAITETRERFAALTADTPQGYESVREAIAFVRETRVKVEHRRVELKADALAYGRLVDSRAKRLTDLLVEIENPLKAKKQAVDDEKARVKAEAEAVFKRAMEEKIRQEREAKEAIERAEREVEEKRLAEERAALAADRARLDEERRQADAIAQIERDRVAAERAAQEAEAQRERDRLAAEREAMEAERQTIADERARIERAEIERVALAKAEADAEMKAEADRVAAAERQASADALRPDVDKVLQFAVSLRQMPIPAVASGVAKALLRSAANDLEAIAAGLESAIQAVA